MYENLKKLVTQKTAQAPQPPSFDPRHPPWMDGGAVPGAAAANADAVAGPATQHTNAARRKDERRGRLLAARGGTRGGGAGGSMAPGWGHMLARHQFNHYRPTGIGWGGMQPVFGNQGYLARHGGQSMGRYLADMGARRLI